MEHDEGLKRAGNDSAAAGRFRLEPQELAWALLYAVCFAAAAWQGVSSAAAGGLAALCGSLIAVVWRDHRMNSAASHRLRLYWPVLMMPLVYALLPGVSLRGIGGPEILQQADGVMAGGNVSLRMEPLISPLLSEFSSLCYLAFYPLMVFAVTGSWQSGAGRLEYALRLMGVLYGLGFIGYVLLPAGGPYIEMPERFTRPVRGWLFTDLCDFAVVTGSNRVDCFPSLHCAVSAGVLLGEWKYRRPWFWRLLVPVAGIWFATLYLRQHYFADVVAAVPLLMAGALLVRAWPEARKPGVQ